MVQGVTLLHLFRGLTTCPAENGVWPMGGHVTNPEPIGNCPGTRRTAPGRAEFCMWGQSWWPGALSGQDPGVQPRGSKAPMGG